MNLIPELHNNWLRVDRMYKPNKQKSHQIDKLKQKSFRSTAGDFIFFDGNAPKKANKITRSDRAQVPVRA